MAHFNYNPIRDTAINLIKKFGRKAPCSLLRALEGAPADTNKPWRRGAPSILEFKFIGIVTSMGFPKRSDPITDMDVDVYVPGDIDTTAAEGNPGIFVGKLVLTDRIDSGDQQLGIIGIQDITPDDKTIMYTVRCRAWPLITSAPQTPF